MRFSALVLIAGTLTVAGPAIAQNTAETATNTDVTANVVAANDTAVLATNEMVAPAPIAEPTTPPADTAPAPPKERSLPWGLLGLLGLVGLFGKRNRTG